MRQLLSALMALILSLTGAQTAPVRTDAALTKFSFNHGGMSMDQIFSYAVREQDGRMFADFELYCRYEIEGVELDAADVEALRALIDENDLWLWNGFQESNSYVLDGDSFGLSASFADGTLYRGMKKCDEVVELQRMLIDLKFLNDKADGIFGKKTEQAVKDYQKWARFEVTGVAYPQTRNAVGSSWEELMATTAAPTPVPTPVPTAVPTPVPTEAPVEYPVCCTVTVDESGAEHIAYCELHDAIHQAAAQLLAEAKTDAAVANAWKIARSMWSAELDSLYDRWKAAVAPEELPQIAGDQALFLAMLNSQEGLMKNRGASQQAMDEKAANLLMEQCVYVCAAMYAQSLA